MEKEGARGYKPLAPSFQSRMSLRLYRVSIPCRMLVLAYDEQAARDFGVEDIDAQTEAMQLEEVTVMKLTKPEQARGKELDVVPFFADGVKEKIIRKASSWLLIIAAEEEEERLRQEDFSRRQLKLPGVE